MANVKNSKALIVKANELVEAHYKLTVTEQRILLLMISKIGINDSEFKEFTFTVREFLDALEIDRNNLFKEIHTILKRLMERVVFIRSEDKSYLTHWVQTAEIDNKTGIITLTFDSNLKPYLLGLKERFTAYQLQNVIQLKSSYSIRLYELLKQYQKLGSREFTLIELRKILGIPEGDYLVYNNFKQRVILPSQAELLEKTDISFEYTEKKTGRAVTGIKFHIFNKQTVIDVEYSVHDEYDEAISKLSAYEQDLFKRLQKDFRLSKKQSHIVITVYLLRKGKDYVDAVLAYVQGYHRKALKVDASAHVGAITWAAFKDGWVVGQDNQTGPKTTSKQAKSKPKEIIPEPTEEERKEIKKMLDDFKRKSYRDA